MKIITGRTAQWGQFLVCRVRTFFARNLTERLTVAWRDLVSPPTPSVRGSFRLIRSFCLPVLGRAGSGVTGAPLKLDRTTEGTPWENRKIEFRPNTGRLHWERSAGAD